MEPARAAVVRAFDRMAPVYDGLYGDAVNALMAWLRAESLGILRRLIPAGSRLLEIGCGTGEETLALTRAGYRVLAVDISPGMIRRARRKALAAGLEGRVDFLVMAASLAAFGLARRSTGPMRVSGPSTASRSWVGSEPPWGSYSVRGPRL